MIRPWEDKPNRLPVTAATANNEGIRHANGDTRHANHAGDDIALTVDHGRHSTGGCLSRTRHYRFLSQSTSKRLTENVPVKGVSEQWARTLCRPKYPETNALNTKILRCHCVTLTPSLPRNGKRLEGTAALPILRFLELLRWVIASQQRARYLPCRPV